MREERTITGTELLAGQICRIQGYSENEERVYLCTLSGLCYVVKTPEKVSLPKGKMIFLRENGEISPIPDGIFSDRKDLAVVRKILPDKNKVIVESSTSGLKAVSCGMETSIAEGNIVELDYEGCITDLLSEDPIKVFEGSPESADSDKSRFLVSINEKLELEDFGGYEREKKELSNLINLRFNHFEALENMGAKKPKGILLSGPPGVGKTYLAQIMASINEIAFYVVNGPELVSKWVGESAKNLRELFAEAATKEKAIIFFDEFDSIASKRSESQNSEGMSIVNQLLTLLNGFKDKGNILVIAATNRSEYIDSAFKRPGRLDKEIVFTLPSYKDRLAILKLSIKEEFVGNNLPLEYIAQNSSGWSGAQIASIWDESAYRSRLDGRDKIYSEDYLIVFERIGKELKREARMVREEQS